MWTLYIGKAQSASGIPREKNMYVCTADISKTFSKTLKELVLRAWVSDDMIVTSCMPQGMLVSFQLPHLEEMELTSRSDNGRNSHQANNCNILLHNTYTCRSNFYIKGYLTSSCVSAFIHFHDYFFCNCLPTKLMPIPSGVEQRIPVKQDIAMYM